jgi:hypothetical protein
MAAASGFGPERPLSLRPTTMHRVVFAISLFLLGGCGSCVEDKKVPPVEHSTGPAATVMKTTEAGTQQPIVVGKSYPTALVNYLGRDGGADAGH